MAITFAPEAIDSSRGWALLTAIRQRFASLQRSYFQDHENSMALRSLSTLDERELNDIGISRAELSCEGLKIAGARRARRQAAIDAELAEHGWPHSDRAGTCGEK